MTATRASRKADSPNVISVLNPLAAGQRLWPISISLHLTSKPAAGENEGQHTPACGAFEPRGDAVQTSSEEPTPVFQLASAVSLARKGNLKELAAHLSKHQPLDRCPECGVHCKPMYITRHVIKQHEWIQPAHAQVVAWARQCQVPSQPVSVVRHLL